LRILGRACDMGDGLPRSVTTSMQAHSVYTE
jgi:hypothetical protein